MRERERDNRVEIGQTVRDRKTDTYIPKARDVIDALKGCDKSEIMHARRVSLSTCTGSLNMLILSDDPRIKTRNKYPKPQQYPYMYIHIHMYVRIYTHV